MIRKCVIGCNADPVPDVGYNDTECSKDFYVKLGENRQGKEDAILAMSQGTGVSSRSRGGRACLPRGCARHTCKGESESE